MERVMREIKNRERKRGEVREAELLFPEDSQQEVFVCVCVR